MRSPFRKSQDYTFEPVFTPQEAIDKTIVWDCNDTSIISIEQNGTITALAIGEVNITATLASDNTIQASAIVIVDREIAQIVVGGSHSVILDTKGDVWVAGGNENGQLGIGNNDDSAKFVKIKTIGTMGKAVSVAAGKTHTLAVDSDGNIWATGDNTYGQLGSGDFERRNRFEKVKAGSFASVVAGQNHSVALDSEGIVWIAGSNEYGQLGHFLAPPYSVEFSIILTGDAPITRIAAGYDNTFVVNNAGKVWVTGRNDYGEFGRGDTQNLIWFNTVPNIENAISAAVGISSSYVLDANKNVWASGYNASGDLGIGSLEYQETSFSKAISDVDFDGKVSRNTYDLTNIVDISAGYYRVLAVDNSGSLWTTGANHLYFPIDTSRDQYYKDMCMYYYDYPPSHEICESKRSFNKILNISGVKSVAVSDYYALAVDTNGSLWATGVNSRGQLGFGDVEARYGFEKVPLPQIVICQEGKYLDEESGECRQKVTRIYFFNGIATNLQETENGKNILQKLYLKKFKDDHPGEVFQFDIGYNFSFGVISDLTEVFRQKWAEKQGEDMNLSKAYSIMKRCVDEHWLKTDPTCQNFAVMQKELSESIEETGLSQENAEVALEKFNEAAIIVKLNEKLKNGGRTVIVAHSQGNLFGNKAYSALIKEYPDQVGMIGVASPAGWKGGKNYYYVTAHDDVVIDLLRLANALTLKLFVGEVLPSNVDNVVPCGHYARGVFNHSFHDGYPYWDTFNRKNEWWIGTEYEFLLSIPCPQGITEIKLSSRKMIDAYFNALFDAMRFTKSKQ
jgi:alpha-tubulin suppressor-like RCC1 family protein